MNLTMKPARKATQESAKNISHTSKKFRGFTDEEKAAMKERIQELKAEKADGETAVLSKIAAMKGQDRTLGERLHGINKESTPGIAPRLWYGMPAYSKKGKLVCFFQDAQKFKARYATLGFIDKANLDEGSVWATTFALKGLTATEEARIKALLKKAVG